MLWGLIEAINGGGFVSAVKREVQHVHTLIHSYLSTRTKKTIKNWHLTRLIVQWRLDDATGARLTALMTRQQWHHPELIQEIRSGNPKQFGKRALITSLAISYPTRVKSDLWPRLIVWWRHRNDAWLIALALVTIRGHVVPTVSNSIHLLSVLLFVHVIFAETIGHILI